jgi:hypothetical protein
MDANNNNETRQRRREEALVRRLGEAFDRLGPHGTGDCPDSEQFALYHEQALAPEEAARCEGHFAACPRCRKILAVLAASAEAPLEDQEVARLGELASAAQGKPRREPTVKPERFGGFHWRLRWLVPAFGAAAAVILWFAVRPPWRPAGPTSNPTLIAEGPKPLAPTAGENATPARNPAAVPSNAVAKSAAVTLKAKEAGAPKGLKQEPSSSDNLVALEKGKNERLASNEKSVGGTLSAALTRDPEADKKSDRRDLSGVSGGLISSGAPAPRQATAPVPAAPPQPPAAAPAAEAQLQTREQAPPTSRKAAAPSSGATQTPEVEAYARSELRASSKTAEVLLDSAKVASTPLIKSPSSQTQWRARGDGSIEISKDGGRVWQTQESPLREGWLAGAAVSDSVSWLVGRNGAIARTTDGEHWERITPPGSAADPSGKQPDWLDVQATDAQTATISASAQQRYTTRDGGKTWQKQ